MSWRNKFIASNGAASISWFDVVVIALLLLGGLIYLHDSLYWGVGWIGESQYGDAQFWWNGALHIAQGIFQNNPGKGFRPGYFILTGLTLPVLGTQFKQYYPYFLITFLITSSLFYLALRQLLGRWVAAFVAAMLVFNPFTAEWLATSTTDGTGLLLHVAALTCLVIGVSKNLRLGWLAGFGILFALATLTRPLVTPFIGIAILALLLFPSEPFKKRMAAAAIVVIAFFLPTLSWMAAQKLTIDRWAISTNDASAFYGASDPAIQVWTPTMYDHVQQLAAKQYHVEQSKVDDQMLNDVFWQETVKNYINNPAYHLSRVLPHLWRIASFNPKLSAHGTDALRIAFLELIIAGLSLRLLLQKRKTRAAFLMSLGIGLYYLPWMMTYFILAGALFALTEYRNNKLGIFLLGAYWLTGVAALYFVGGTWGKPSFTSVFDINALGYRLGSQVFFAGDLLAAYCMVWLATFNIKQAQQNSIGLNHDQHEWQQAIIERPVPLASKMVLGMFGVFLAALISIYLIGSATVIQRSYARHNTLAEPYPSLEQIRNVYKKQSGYRLIQAAAKNGALDNQALTHSKVKTGDTDIIFTGGISSFIWNIPGQERAQIMIYSQQQMRPITMGPGFVFLDIPQHVQAKDWIGKQGAFIIRPLPDNYNKSNQAYYLTNPALRAFIPLSSDGKQFDLTKIVWFPLSKNATQLKSNGELRFQNAKITWAQNSGPAPYQRRFFLAPKKEGEIKLTVDVSSAKKPANLSFAYSMDKVPGVNRKETAQSNIDLGISINNQKSNNHKLILSKHNTAVENDASLKNITLSIPAGTKSLTLSFKHLAPGVGIWIYEFNLNADDFVHRAVKTAPTLGDA